MSSVNVAQSQVPVPPVTQQTFSIRLPKDLKTTKKKYAVLKFGSSCGSIDFTKCGVAKIERENNLKDFKSAYDIETAPKFGAGSEFGRDQREEARKKKFGVHIRKYNSDDQPWLLRVGSGTPSAPPKKMKGTREGGITENASYYIFMQCSDGKAFEAYPVNEWYNFLPQTKHATLGSEEAEEEFSRRNKTMNYFSIMLRNKLKNSDDTDKLEDGETVEKGKKSRSSLLISEFDEMSQSEDDADESDDGERDDEDQAQRKKAKSKPKKQKKFMKKKKSNEEGDDDEPMEESDEFDEGEEVDYISGSSSDDEMMYDDKGRDDSDKYQDKGVEDEEGLRKIVDSGDEDEDEEDKKEEENEEDDETRAKDGKEKDSDSESSSDSDSESDPEKDSNFASALFMQQDKRSTVKQESSNSRPSTPANSSADSGTKAKKRKTEDSPLVAGKKQKTEIAGPSQPYTPVVASSVSSGTPAGSSSNIATGSENITEETVRRYLLRRPMTTKELVQKFKSKNAGMSKEQITLTMSQILKRLNPQQKKVNGTVTWILTK